MEDIQLLETIEKYLSGELSDQERAQFDVIRQKSADIDQMVVEHKLFLDQMETYAKRKNVAHTSQQVFSSLLANGEWAPIEAGVEPSKVIKLWSKYKKVIAIAASFGGFFAIFTSIIVMYLSPSLNGSQLLQLSKAVEVIKKNQQAQGHLLNEVKTKVPENAKLISGGSGFLIDTKGYIITNAHVLKGDGAIVINSKGQELNASIIYSDVTNDLALLKIEDKDYKQPKSIPYAIRRKISDLGEEIFTLGFPRNDNDIVYGKGYLSAQTGYEGDSSSYQIQISANPGYSGAPIFNSNGELIGVISTRQKLAEGVAFAVKSTEIIDVVNALKDNEKTKDINIKLPKYASSNARNRKSQLDNLKNFMYSVRSFN
jgi:S1-C subfamily serine protease